jgi:hypothetical protein
MIPSASVSTFRHVVLAAPSSEGSPQRGTGVASLVGDWFASPSEGVTRALATAAAMTAGLLLAACERDEYAATGRSEERTVGGFDYVDLRGRTDLTVRRGSRRTLTLHGGERLLDDVTTTVTRRRLTIEREGRIGPPLEATITLPQLPGVNADIAGRVALVDMYADELELHQNGAGTLLASGHVDTLTETLGGVGELQLTTLTAQRATVHVSGTGRAEVTVAASSRPPSPASAAASASASAPSSTTDPIVHPEVRSLGDVHVASCAPGESGGRGRCRPCI